MPCANPLPSQRKIDSPPRLPAYIRTYIPPCPPIFLGGFSLPIFFVVEKANLLVLVSGARPGGATLLYTTTAILYKIQLLCRMAIARENALSAPHTQQPSAHYVVRLATPNRHEKRVDRFCSSSKYSVDYPKLNQNITSS